MHENQVLAVCIPGATEYIAIARNAVDAVGEQLHLSHEVRAAIKLAVGEACDNAVRHAKRSGHRNSSVLVVCRAGPEALEVDVTNPGNGFHPGAHPAMPPAEALTEHGRGLALMELLMDSVQYLSRKGNTTVRMRKLRESAH